MIKNIKIENYRRLNLELKDCTQVNIIVGSTETGKTTVLEEIKYGSRYAQAVVDSNDYKHLRRAYWNIEGELPEEEEDSEIGTTVIHKNENRLRSEMVNNIPDFPYRNEQIDEVLALLHPKLDNKRYSYSLSIHKMRSIINCLTSKKIGLLLIDDIEIGWHISVFKPYLKWILKLAKEKNVQLFISTHSLEIIDAILFADIDMDINDITLFNLNKKNKRFSGRLLKELRCSGLEVR